MINSQINFGIDCIKRMKHYQLDYIEPKEEAQEKFSSDLKNDLESTVWVKGGCKSWYQNDKTGVSPNHFQYICNSIAQYHF